MAAARGWRLPLLLLLVVIARATSSCSVNGLLDGNETGTDCGGGAGCPPCAAGGGCWGPADCAAGVCAYVALPGNASAADDDGGGGGVSGAALVESAGNGTCAPPTCDDRAQNGLETDTDCGGGVCQPCLAGYECRAPRDCAAGLVCGPQSACVPSEWAPPLPPHLPGATTAVRLLANVTLAGVDRGALPFFVNATGGSTASRADWTAALSSFFVDAPAAGLLPSAAAPVTTPLWTLPLPCPLPVEHGEGAYLAARMRAAKAADWTDTNLTFQVAWGDLLASSSPSPATLVGVDIRVPAGLGDAVRARLLAAGTMALPANGGWERLRALVEQAEGLAQDLALCVREYGGGAGATFPVQGARDLTGASCARFLLTADLPPAPLPAWLPPDIAAALTCANGSHAPVDVVRLLEGVATLPLAEWLDAESGIGAAPGATGVDVGPDALPPVPAAAALAPAALRVAQSPRGTNATAITSSLPFPVQPRVALLDALLRGNVSCTAGAAWTVWVTLDPASTSAGAALLAPYHSSPTVVPGSQNVHSFEGLAVQASAQIIGARLLFNASCAGSGGVWFSSWSAPFDVAPLAPSTPGGGGAGGASQTTVVGTSVAAGLDVNAIAGIAASAVILLSGLVVVVVHRRYRGKSLALACGRLVGRGAGAGAGAGAGKASPRSPPKKGAAKKATTGEAVSSASSAASGATRESGRAPAPTSAGPAAAKAASRRTPRGQQQVGRQPKARGLPPAAAAASPIGDAAMPKSALVVRRGLPGAGAEAAAGAAGAAPGGTGLLSGDGSSSKRVGWVDEPEGEDGDTEADIPARPRRAVAAAWTSDSPKAARGDERGGGRVERANAGRQR
jgi:hypothetical protein